MESREREKLSVPPPSENSAIAFKEWKRTVDSIAEAISAPAFIKLADLEVKNFGVAGKSKAYNVTSMYERLGAMDKSTGIRLKDKIYEAAECPQESRSRTVQSKLVFSNMK